MIRTLILICQLSLSPAECTPDTARAVIDGGEHVICTGMAPQALIAATSLRARSGERIVVKCERPA